MIRLKFTGVEVSLLTVPSSLGGKYLVKIDDEPEEELDNFQPGAKQCQVTVGWTRSNLENKPHNVTVTIKGSSAGVSSSSGVGQLEFSGLM